MGLFGDLFGGSARTPTGRSVSMTPPTGYQKPQKKKWWRVYYENNRKPDRFSDYKDFQSEWEARNFANAKQAGPGHFEAKIEVIEK